MRLAIDTATSRLSVALGNSSTSALHEEVEGARQHAAALLPAIDRLLAQAGMKREAILSVVIADGPGSFTGLRVGAAVAKALVSWASRTRVALKEPWFTAGEDVSSASPG